MPHSVGLPRRSQRSLFYVMQMSFQLFTGARLRRSASVALILTLGFVAELRAEPLASAWIAGGKSAARLIAAPAATAGAFRAGVEIRLDPGALTYWRSPGEAGAAPVFDFAASDNVKAARVLFPAPSRIDEAGFDMFGYRGAVTFPVEVELADARRPAVLALTLDYAVCDAICLPVKTKAALALPAWAPTAASPEAAALDAAWRRAPERLDAAARDAKFAIARVEGATPPTWRIRLKDAPAEAADLADAAADLFVEFPDGWFFTSKRSENLNEFIVVEEQAPAVGGALGGAASAGKIPLTLTLAQPRQSFEFTLEVDAGAPVAAAAAAPRAGPKQGTEQ